MIVTDKLSGSLVGQIKVSTASSSLSLEEVLDSIDSLPTQFAGDNLVVNTASSVIVGLLMRDFSNYMPYYIGIGDGGDLDQSTGIDTGSRVAPDVEDTELRSVVARLPIIQVRPVSATSWTYVAIARPPEALTASLNELSLESMNNTLISHYIEPAIDNRAQKHVKTSLEYLVIQWTLTFTIG